MANVYVCDAIMGTGKSSAAIRYMNEHPDEHFIYVTPYLDEADRIHVACPELQFVKPNRAWQNGCSKVNHTRKLLEQGKNITTTHAAFKLYERDMIDNIQRFGYTLIIDEAFQFLEDVVAHPGDVKLLEEAGYLCRIGNARFEKTDSAYEGLVLRGIYEEISRSNLLMLHENGKDVAYYCWELPPDVFMAFRQVYVLTYLFDGQEMDCYLHMHNIPYTKIGIDRDEAGFYFSETERYVPEYVRTLRQKIRIFDNEKLNSIGAGKFALSSSWYEHADQNDVERVRKNIANYFGNYHRGEASKYMWTCFKDEQFKLRGAGYARHYTAFNIRATNDLRQKSVMAYAVNIFCNPFRKRYLSTSGVAFDDDVFALSTLVQWIWRGAIRDGGEIEIYLPSERMRQLLLDWIDKVEAESRGVENGAA